jgi:hypothetical protein
MISINKTSFTIILRGIIVLTYLLAIYKIEIIFISNICLSVLSCLFEPAKQSTLKNIVNQNHLVTANSLSSTINGFMSIMGACLLQGIFFLGFILSDQLIIGIITLLCMRIAGGIIVPLDTTLLQTYTHENMIGKVFSFHYSIYGSLIQLSMFFTGWLLEIFSPQIIGSLLAICCIFVSFIWLFLFYRGELSEESTIT